MEEDWREEQPTLLLGLHPYGSGASDDPQVGKGYFVKQEKKIPTDLMLTNE